MNTQAQAAAYTPGRWLLTWLYAACVTATGCGFTIQSKEYGGVQYPHKTASINGLGVFEKLCTQAGSRCFVTDRLSMRLDKADAIVLVGTSFHPPAKEARDWLEQWLSEERGRTVVYFGRDFDADIYYRERTLEQVPSSERPRAAFELALARAELDALLLGGVNEDVFCRWFNLKIRRPRVNELDFTGDWSMDLKSVEASWPVRVTLEPPVADQRRRKPKWLAEPSASATFNPVQPMRPSKVDKEEAQIYRSVWSHYDINDDDTWKEEWAKLPNSQVLLTGRNGTPLVCRLTSQRYAGSQIVTIVNGAPLLNGSIVEPHFLSVAHRIVDSMQPAKRIALLPFGTEGILISNVEDEAETAGLSVLTTWPMNFIVAHLAFLGVLICLALFPILGRPQGLPKHSLSDFGQHAEAVGRMLQRTGDVQYALRIVADYYRTVRGEAVPTWLKSARQQTATSEPNASPTSSNTDSSA